MTSRAPGRVARIRLTPQDCLGVLDVVEVLGLTLERFSFDQAARIALSALLDSARSAGTIPTRSGFEFLERMQRVKVTAGADLAGKLEQARLLNANATSSMQGPKLSPATQRVSPSPRYQELAFKLEQDPLNFTQGERDELSQLTQQFFPME